MTGYFPRRAHLRRWGLALAGRARRIGSLSAQAAWRGFTSLYNSDDLTHSASIAYYALLSLFPFLLLVVSVLGVVHRRRGRPARPRSTSCCGTFPRASSSSADQITALQRTQVPLGVMGGLALIWASLGFFSAINSAVNSAWRVERQRSYLKHKLVAFLMLAASCGLLALDAGRVQREPGGRRVLVYHRRRTVSVADGVAEFRRELGGDLRADPGGRAGVLLRAQREGPLPRCVGRRHPDGPAVAVGVCGLLMVRARHVALQRARIDWRRRDLPAVGVCVGGDPAVRRRVHRRLQPDPPGPRPTRPPRRLR